METQRVKKKNLFYALVLIFSFVTLPFLSAQSTPAPKESRPSNSEAKITVAPPATTIPIKEEVKIFRAERRKKMPYLDHGYLKESISPKTVIAKQSFIGGGDKNLDEVINRAIEVYTPAKASKERITLAKRRILVATRELLPSADFNFEFRNGSLSKDPFIGNDYHFAFKIPVFRGGILWNTLLREKAELRAAKKEYEGVLNEMVDEVAKAYFEFNRAREVYEDKKKLLGEAQKKQELSQKKYKEALISEIEYLNTESMAGQVQYDVETASQELELAELELQRFLGLDIGDEIRIAPLYNADELIAKAVASSEEKKEGKKSGIIQALDEFIDLAYQHRPELQVEAERLRSARLEEKISRGSFLPRVDVNMKFGELGESFTRDSLDPVHHSEWEGGFEISDNFFGNKAKYSFDHNQNAPSVAQFLQGSGSRVSKRHFEIGLFDGLKEYSELQEAKVKKLEQVIELEKKEREVIREVKEAYFDYHKAEVQVESSLKRNQYRERLVKLAEIRLGKAEIEISDYLQAQLDLAEERARLHRALADLSKAKSKLNRAIGMRNFLPIEERYGL